MDTVHEGKRVFVEVTILIARLDAAPQSSSISFDPKCIKNCNKANK